MAPQVTATSVSGSAAYPFSSASMRATPARNSGMPGCRVYFPAEGSLRRAEHTASTTKSGVAKEGTPCPRDTQPPTSAASMGIRLVSEILMRRTRRVSPGRLMNPP